MAINDAEYAEFLEWQKWKAMKKQAANESAAVAGAKAETKTTWKDEGKKLRNILHDFKIRVDEFAVMAGISSTTTHRWLTGAGRITYSQIANNTSVPLTLRKEILRIAGKEAEITVTGLTKTCRMCGRQFQARCQSVYFCSECESTRRKEQDAFFLKYPQVLEVLKTRYRDVSNARFNWVIGCAPAMCTVDLIREKCGDEVAKEFARVFRCSTVCSGVKSAWCVISPAQRKSFDAKAQKQ